MTGQCSNWKATWCLISTGMVWSRDGGRALASSGEYSDLVLDTEWMTITFYSFIDKHKHALLHQCFEWRHWKSEPVIWVQGTGGLSGTRCLQPQIGQEISAEEFMKSDSLMFVTHEGWHAVLVSRLTELLPGWPVIVTPIHPWPYGTWTLNIRSLSFL